MVEIGKLFSFFGAPVQREINHIKPGESSVQHSPQDRTIPGPRTNHRQGSTERDTTDIRRCRCVSHYFLGMATLPVRVKSTTPNVFMRVRNFSTLLPSPVISIV